MNTKLMDSAKILKQEEEEEEEEELLTCVFLTLE
jgi:hypothetical protein